MIKIYIAGKVTGLPIKEVKEKFDAASQKLIKAGFEVINPVELVNDAAMEWNAAMKLCIASMVHCDAILLLSDWKTSKGASVEAQIGSIVEIPIFESHWLLTKHFENDTH